MVGLVVIVSPVMVVPCSAVMVPVGEGVAAELARCLAQDSIHGSIVPIHGSRSESSHPQPDPEDHQAAACSV